MESITIESVLISIITLAVFFAINAAIGWYLSRSQKPYGAVKLTAHIVFFLLVLGGVIASIFKLQAFIGNKLFSTMFLYLAGLTVLVNLAVGIRMIIIKQKDISLVKVLLTMTPGGFERSFKDRSELLKTVKADDPDFRKKRKENAAKWKYDVEFLENWDLKN